MLKLNILLPIAGLAVLVATVFVRGNFIPATEQHVTQPEQDGIQSSEIVETSSNTAETSYEQAPISEAIVPPLAAGYVSPIQQTAQTSQGNLMSVYVGAYSTKELKDLDYTEMVSFGWFPPNSSYGWSGRVTLSGCDDPSSNGSRPWMPMSLENMNNMSDLMGVKIGAYRIVPGEVWAGCNVILAYQGKGKSGEDLSDSVSATFRHKTGTSASSVPPIAHLSVNGSTIISDVDYTLPLIYEWSSQSGTSWAGRVVLGNNCALLNPFILAGSGIESGKWSQWPNTLWGKLPPGSVTMDGNAQKGTSTVTPGWPWKGCTATWTYKVMNANGAMSESIVTVTFKSS